jgi:hypothetical protein
MFRSRPRLVREETQWGEMPGKSGKAHYTRTFAKDSPLFCCLQGAGASPVRIKGHNPQYWG